MSELLNVVNLTPHEIVVKNETGSVSFPSKGLARVKQTPGVEIENSWGLKLFTSPTVGEVEGLPEPNEGTIYLVSAIVLARCAGRSDVFAPGTGPADGAIRNPENQIVAVTRLIQAPKS